MSFDISSAISVLRISKADRAVVLQRELPNRAEELKSLITELATKTLTHSSRWSHFLNNYQRNYFSYLMPVGMVKEYSSFRDEHNQWILSIDPLKTQILSGLKAECEEEELYNEKLTTSGDSVQILNSNERLQKLADLIDSVKYLNFS